MVMGSLLGPLGLDSTLQAIRALFRDGVGAQVTGELGSFRDGFSAAPLDATSWSESVGAGMTTAVTGGAYVVQMGTTAGAETVLDGKVKFQLPLKARYWVGMSQRIANQTVYLELVNDANDTVARWELSGATTTTAFGTIIRKGVTDGPTAQSIAATSATPQIYELDANIESLQWAYKAQNNTGAWNTTLLRDATIPAMRENYRLRLRFTNGATAPASNTAVTVGAVMVVDDSRLPVEIKKGPGTTTSERALAVVGAGGTITANFQQTNVQTTALTALLAAGATTALTALDASTSYIYDRTRVVVQHATAAQVPAQLILEESVDGTTYRETWRVPIPGDGLVRSFERPYSMRFHRWRLTNGSQVQTVSYLIAMTSRVTGETTNPTLIQFTLSTTALTANQQFTGPTLDLGPQPFHDRFRALVVTDQASAAGGFQVQQSHDGATWVTLPAHAATAVANNATPLEGTVHLRYLRLVVLNGTTAQGTLRAHLELVGT